MLCAVGLALAISDPAHGQVTAGANQIVLGANWGTHVPLAPGLLPSFLPKDIHPGLGEGVVRRIQIEQTVRDRFLVQFDYDGEREGGFLGAENTYALTYTDPGDGFLRLLTIGNKERSIPGSRYLPLDAGSPDSYALRLRAGTPEEAAERAPRIGLDALVRYGASVERTKRFRGARQLREARLADVEYIKRRYYHLPDTLLDESSLRVLRSARDVGDLEIGGQRMSVLERGTDYTFDNATAYLLLTRALTRSETLLVYYERGTVPVGDATLGALAIIDDSGQRRDFSQATHPQYFLSDGELSYLILRTEGLQSYWELKNAYVLEGLEGEDPGPIEIRLVSSTTGLENSSYADVLARRTVDLARGVLFFQPRDAVGPYPRPFPGERPFTDPVAPVNPFAPDNPIYGGLADPLPAASVNTLVVRYSPRTEELFIDYDIIEESVRVRVDGVELAPGQFRMDYAAGVLTFSPGVVAPSSDIETRYSVLASTSDRQDVVVGLGGEIEMALGALRVFSRARIPVLPPEAPRVGEERERSYAAGLDGHLSVGASVGESGPAAEISLASALVSGTANARGSALIADMSTGVQETVSTEEQYWIPGSRSALLGASASPVALGLRGPLLYRDYWKVSVVGGDSLQPLSWDNTGNPAHTYAEKSGPYNTADQAPGRTDRALVLDFTLDPGTTDPAYVSVATSLGARDLSGYDRLDLALRGHAITGGPVRVYAELLRVYQEDLNGNDTLDSESTVAQEGLTITPVDGDATVLGTDHRGRPDGRLTTEDLNANGVLDPAGPFALDAEEGVILGPDDGPLADIPAADDNWVLAGLDIRSLVAAHPAVFQEAHVLRLTVVSTDPSVASSGRLVVGGIWLSRAPVQNVSPEYLSLREAGVASGVLAAQDALSIAYPEAYETLHGSMSRRADTGHDERTLIARLEAPLPQGEAATIAVRFGAPQALSAYGELRVYVRVPSWPPAQSAGFRLDVESTPADLLRATVSATQLREGWNEVTVLMSTPYEVRLNGLPAGQAEVMGSGGILEAVRAVALSVTAPTGDVPVGFEFYTDEWHLARARTTLAAAVAAEVVVGYRGALLGLPRGRDPRGWVMLGDILLRAGTEWRNGDLADTPGVAAWTWWVDQQAVLLGVLKPRARVGGTLRTAPTVSTAAPLGSGSTWSYGLAVDTGVPWLPVLDHAYHSSITTTTGLGLGDTGYVGLAGNRNSRSVTFEERLSPFTALTQSYLYSRTWDYEQTEGQSATETHRMTQIHDAQIRAAWQGRRVTGSFRREEAWTTQEPAAAQDALASYAQAMTGSLKPASEALPQGRMDARSDKALLDLVLPRQRYLGVAAKSEVTYRERDVDPATGARATDLATSLSLSLPFSPDGQGGFQLTPAASHVMSWSARSAPADFTEILLLSKVYPLLLRPPLYYLGFLVEPSRIRALQATGVHTDTEDLERVSTARLATTVSLTGQIKTPPWFLPSPMSLTLQGETRRSGLVYGQSGTLTARMGKSLVIPAPEGARPTSASFDLIYRHGRNYGTKVISHGGTLTAGLSLPVGQGGGLSIQQSTNYTGERQRLDDPSLVLWPDGAIQEPTVATRPDRHTLQVKLGVELRSDRPVEGTRSQLVFRRLPAGNERLQMRNRIDVETLRVFTDPTRVAAFTTIPFRVLLTHETLFQQSEYLALQLLIKATAGVEELVSAKGTTRVPAMGFELEGNIHLMF